MSETTDLENQLKTQQSDYLKRLEAGGQLPTVISKAWNEAGGAETTALRGQEGKLLTDYVAAGANNRAKYKDVWDPFQRDALAANQTAMDYKPIADIRSELAMRAEALGIATQSSQAMYGAGTQMAETNLGFTQSAYDRAAAREAEIQRQSEFQQSLAGQGSSRAAAAAKPTEAQVKAAALAGVNEDIMSNFSVGPTAKGFTEKTLIPRLVTAYPELTRKEIVDLVYNTRRSSFGF